MKPGEFSLVVHIAGFTVSCSRCRKTIYFSEASKPNDYNGLEILTLVASHECPAPEKRAA